MIIKIQQSELMKGLNIVSKAVPSRTTMPILECIVMKAEDDKIKLIANNMELGIETIIEGSIEEKGSVAITSRKFIDIIRKFPDNEIKIIADEQHNIAIKFSSEESSSINLQGFGTEEFPIPSHVEKNKKVTLSQFTMKEMIRQTIFSVSRDEQNIVMTGELLEIKGNKMRLIAIDGVRIAIRRVTLSEEQEEISVIIPGKTLSEISKLLSTELEDKMDIYFAEKHIMFEFNNTLIHSRLINDNFYKVDRMFTNDYETKIQLNRKQLLEKIDIVSAIISESDKKPLILNIKDGEMELKARTSTAKSRFELEIEKEGKDILIGFNPYFLMDAIRVIDDEDLNIYFFNSKSPCFIKDKEESYNYVISPINFSSEDID